MTKDISACERCGSYEHIWHIWGKGDRRDEIVGSVCTQCLWTCGEAGIITAIECKMEELYIKIDQAIEGRRRGLEMCRRIKSIVRSRRRRK